jgi:hypothetical protein
MVGKILGLIISNLAEMVKYRLYTDLSYVFPDQPVRDNSSEHRFIG